MESYKLKSKIVFYYDFNNQTIARIPTKSNLKYKGSDNSLYFGTISNIGSKEIFCELLRKKSIDKINGLNMKMMGYGIPVDVNFNINKEGQIQIKVMHDGMMRKLFEKFQLTIKESIEESKVLIVIDFKNFDIRFKKIVDLEL